VLFLTTRLETVIDLEGISVRLFPLHLKFKCFLWQDIEKIYVREYAPLSEYGGWGLRYSVNHGKAYNVSGNQGVQLFFTNGKKLLIGTQKPEEITAILKQINQLKN
jgi:hypothetical protein